MLDTNAWPIVTPTHSSSLSTTRSRSPWQMATKTLRLMNVAMGMRVKLTYNFIDE